METLEPVKCVRCGVGTKTDDKLNHVGVKFIPGENKVHPVRTLIEQAKNLELTELEEELQKKLDSSSPIYIHVSCRTFLKNNCRSNKNKNEKPSSAVKNTILKRSDLNKFNFKEECFYCGAKCVIDPRHPSRNPFHLVSTTDTKIYLKTLEICKIKKDSQTEKVNQRLRSINDLVAAEARYHKTCRSSFENLKIGQHSIGRPISNKKSESFHKVCKQLEESDEPMTLKEFSRALESVSPDTYCIKTVKNKLKEKYGEDVQFTSRHKKSEVILLSNSRKLLTDAWYKNVQSDVTEEENRIIITAAKLIGNKIKNYDTSVDYYPTVEEIMEGNVTHVPDLLKLFIAQLVKNPLRQESISQSIFACARYRSLMPLQFALSVSLDNRYGSKELNVLLAKLGFACSYDEVIRYKQNVIKYDVTHDVICPPGTESLAFVGDNTDHDLATLDGKNTHHGLGSIAIANGRFGNDPIVRKALPRDAKVPWSTFESNSSIPILTCPMPTRSALKEEIFVPIDTPAYVQKFAYTLCGISRVIMNNTSNWAGYMSTFVKTSVKEKSVISMLPVINLSSTDVNALYSLLAYITDQCSKLNVPTPTVTFDQPLYVKAYDIVASLNLNIFIRLGGFHQLMSFLGSVGRLMEGSGIEAALSNVYAPQAVNHMLSGKAFSRALRGHILCSAVLYSLLLRDFLQSISTEELKSLEQLYSSQKNDGENDTVSIKMMRWLEKRAEELSCVSRTSRLWLNYLNYIGIAQSFIEAERIHDWSSHVLATKQMLNLFSATGHNNYAKTCRLYLQSIQNLDKKHPEVFEQFLKGNHTVRRSEKSWSGIWTDLAIEQVLMRSLKGRGGVVTRGITENVMNVWTKTMHRCAEVADSLDLLLNSSGAFDDHKEITAARIKRDNTDYRKLLDWFEDHNPFKCNENLIALDSGLVDDKNVLNCDNAEAVGRKLHAKLDGSSFANCSFSRKEQIKNMQSLYSKVVIDKQEFSINPMTLFLRMAFAIERRPESEMESFFEYELTPYPTSLFKNGLMRPAMNKSLLKSHFLKNATVNNDSDGTVVADGGSLLWSVKWSSGEPFHNIAQKYIEKCNHLKIATVVFDGYEPSTKDSTRTTRLNKASKVVEVSAEKRCPSDTQDFLSNVTNKQSFIKYLGELLVGNGFKVVTCERDADTTIVKEALNTDGSAVTVIADDTDVFCLLLHHMCEGRTTKKIFIMNMKTEKNSQVRSVYDLEEVSVQNDVYHNKYVLFAHAFSGCDTTSAINRMGKTQILKKLVKLSSLRQLADKFYSEDVTPETIGRTSISIFQLLYSSSPDCPKTLSKLRKEKYVAMIAKDRSVIDPSSLPPSPRAAFYHGLRVYHQINVWRNLLNNDFNPLHWGWRLNGTAYVPIMTDQEAGPKEILKLIRCGCKVKCGKTCSCVKVGLKCSHLCGECNGVTCDNSSLNDEMFEVESEI